MRSPNSMFPLGEESGRGLVGWGRPAPARSCTRKPRPWAGFSAGLLETRCFGACLLRRATKEASPSTLTVALDNRAILSGANARAVALESFFNDPAHDGRDVLA